MNRIEKLFALRQAPLFGKLTDSELVPIVEVAGIRRFAPGEPLRSEAGGVRQLLIVVEGRFFSTASDDEPLFPVIGIESLVLGTSRIGDAVADPREGAVCLSFSKGRFFTIISECPKILTEYLHLRSEFSWLSQQE